jgi:hypothetical protein
LELQTATTAFVSSGGVDKLTVDHATGNIATSGNLQINSPTGTTHQVDVYSTSPTTIALKSNLNTNGGYTSGIEFDGYTAGSSPVAYAGVYGGIESNSNGGQSGQLRLTTIQSGGLINLITLSGTSGHVLMGYTTDLGTGQFLQLNGSILTKGRSFTAANPTLSSCGTSPSVDSASSNSSGTVTVGSVATSCTATFATAYSTYNHCSVTSQSTIASFTYTYTTSTITVTGTSLGGDKFDYSCDGV